MDTVSSATALCLVIVSMTGSYGDQVPEASDCLTVNQTKVFCLSSGPSNHSLPLTCPLGFNVAIFSASVFQRPPATTTCSPEQRADDTECFQLNNHLYQCPGNQCNVIVPTSTSDDLCRGGQGSEARYAVIVYRCQPVFSPWSNATAVATSIDSSLVVSSSLVAINNDPLGLTGVYSPPTPFFCSGLLPTNSEVVLSAPLIQVKDNDEGRRKICVIADVTSDSGEDDDVTGDHDLVRYSFCSSGDRGLVRGCSPRQRYVRISVNNTGTNASIQFTLNLQVSYLAKITMQCREPAFPLIFPTSVTSKEPSNAPPNVEKPFDEFSTKNPKTNDSIGSTLIIVAVVCGVGGLFLAIIIVVLVVVICHRSKSGRVGHHRPLSESSSVSSVISEAKLELSLQTETESKPEFLEKC